MNEPTKEQLLDDLIKLINYDDYEVYTARRIHIFCAYHGLTKNYYSDIERDEVRELLLAEFDTVGEKSETVEDES